MDPFAAFAQSNGHAKSSKKRTRAAPAAAPDLTLELTDLVSATVEPTVTKRKEKRTAATSTTNGHVTSPKKETPKTVTPEPPAPPDTTVSAPKSVIKPTDDAAPAVDAPAADLLALFTEIKRLSGGVNPVQLDLLPRTARTDPCAATYVRHIMTMIPADALAPYLTDETLHELRQHVFVSTRKHDEAMLREPRNNEPACSEGDQCWLYQIPGATRDRTLMAYIYESEWVVYQEAFRKYQAGQASEPVQPTTARKCLLCLRYQVATDVAVLRSQNLWLRIGKKEPGTLVCNFYNVVDVPGEYRSSDCLLPTSTAYHGLVAPVVKFDALSYQMVVHPGTGRMHVKTLLKYPGDDVSTGQYF